MSKYITTLITILATVGCQVTSSTEDGASLTELKYVCGEKTLVVINNGDGWALLNEPDVEVLTTYHGFMLIDNATGIESSLYTSDSGEDFYSENQGEDLNCRVTRNRK